MQNKLLLVLTTIILSSSVYANSIVTPANLNKSSILKTNTTTTNIVSSNKNATSIMNATSNTQDISQQIIEYENYVYQHPENFDNGIKLIELYLNNPTPSKYKYRNVATTLYILSTEKKFQDLNEYQQQYIRNLQENVLKGLKEQPNNPHNLALMSGLSALFGDKEKAYEYAQKAQSINPQLYTFLPGHLYLLDDNIGKAKQLFTEALKYNPRDNETYLWLMQTQYLSGDYKGTIKTAKYLLPYKHLRYTYTVFFYLRALNNLNQNDSEFIADMAPILQKQATEKDKIYTELACIYIGFGSQETGNLLESKAIEANPNRADTYLDLAEAYLKANQIDKVKELLSQAQKLIDTKDEISKYNLISAQINGNKIIGAKELMNSGLYEDAIKVYENSANPNSLDALLGTATCLQYMGNKEKALIYYNKAMSMYPDNADVYYAFAFYFSNNNDNETARKYLNNALRLNPKHKEARKLANHLQMQKEEELMEIAFAYFDSKEYRETIETLDKIISVNPSNIVAYYYKGLTYISMENYHAAITEFLKVIQKAPEFYIVNYSLGIAYDNINDKNEAVKYYKNFIAKANPQTEEEQSYVEYAKTRIQKLAAK